MRLIALLTALNLTGCATVCVLGCNPLAIPRPDTPICEYIVVPPVFETECYNMKTDYDANGNRLPTAKPVKTTYPDALSFALALNKGFGTSTQGWANLRAYLKNLRDHT